MKKFLKFTAMAAVLVASATFASADTIQIGSFGTGDSPMGNNNTSLAYNGFIAQANPPYPANPSGFVSTNPAASTFNISNGGGIWNGPVTNSSWVSFDPQSFPGGADQNANGYYTYTTTFGAATSGPYTGTFNIYADDTVAVYLNGNFTTPLILAGAIGGDAHCADNTPNCLTLDTVNLAVNLIAGLNTNTLTFIVEQTGLHAQGLDFQGNLSSPTPTPEPSTLLLLGTGLIGSAGALLRRSRAKAAR